MAKTLAIINRKGGTGKTTTALNMGAGLMIRGYKVLYIDLDPQTNLTYALRADPDKPGAADILAKTITADAASQRTPDGQIIAASTQLAAADLTLNMTGKEYRLREALKPISKKYDFIIIDTPAALGTLTVNALTAATDALITAQAEIYSLQGISLLSETMEAVRQYCNPQLKICGVLITRYNSRAVLSKDMRANLEAQAKSIGTKLYETAIRECTAIKEAQAMQQSIFTYAPRSNAATDYGAFIDEYLKGEEK